MLNNRKQVSLIILFKSYLRKRRFRQIFFAISGAVIAGLWAYLINLSFGEITAIRAMLAQIILSFISTILLSNLLEKIGSKFSKNIWLFFSLAWMIPIAVLIGIMIVFHFLSGTPRIGITVAPSTIGGSIYSVFYLITFKESISNLSNC